MSKLAKFGTVNHVSQVCVSLKSLVLVKCGGKAFLNHSIVCNFPFLLYTWDVLMDGEILKIGQ